LTRAGKDENKKTKVNQDSHHPLTAGENSYIFSVFDGHEEDGDYVSKACKEVLPP
jgi:serine/threonine protein phosphatase PrpC